jgi:hypothetical protein
MLPLLATLDKLLTHGYLDELLGMPNGDFLDPLLASLSEESKGCSDVKRLLAIVGVSINLLQPHLETIDMVRRLPFSFCHFLVSSFLIFCHINNISILLQQLQQKVLPFVMGMLLNPYPRVRRYVAEQLFAKLSVDGESMFDNNKCLEEANQLLLNVAWHEEHDSSGHIVESRNRIADLLGVKLSKEKRNATLVKKNVSQSSIPKDEFENYSSLINSTTT